MLSGNVFQNYKVKIWKNVNMPGGASTNRRPSFFQHHTTGTAVSIVFCSLRRSAETSTMQSSASIGVSDQDSLQESSRNDTLKRKSDNSESDPISTPMKLQKQLDPVQSKLIKAESKESDSEPTVIASTAIKSDTDASSTTVLPYDSKGRLEAARTPLDKELPVTDGKSSSSS
jgi:hypothetical protein